MSLFTVGQKEQAVFMKKYLYVCMYMSRPIIGWGFHFMYVYVYFALLSNL